MYIAQYVFPVPYLLYDYGQNPAYLFYASFVPCTFARSYYDRITYYYYDTGTFFATYCSLCYSPPNMISHCRQTSSITSKYESHCKRICLSLAMNTFCAGYEHFFRWIRTLLALETNTFKLEINNLDDCYSHR